MRRALIFSFFALAACASPLQRCINNATKDIRVLSGLIATTQNNIERGFAIRQEQFFRNQEQPCGEIEGETVYCEVPVAYEREVPVAIDLNVEAAKLQSLLTKRAELSQRAEGVITECRVNYPQA